MVDYHKHMLREKKVYLGVCRHIKYLHMYLHLVYPVMHTLVYARNLHVQTFTLSTYPWIHLFSNSDIICKTSKKGRGWILVVFRGSTFFLKLQFDPCK